MNQNTRPVDLDLDLDLDRDGDGDGDGLETLALSTTHPIYFDHDADGIKTAIGWIAPDDGFLVLDRNGDGTIDNGTELFGDHTPLSGGGYAGDGFAALAQEDTNLDGTVDAADARFANLRIWRDLNGGGISQAGELSTLADLGIASINVAKTENSILLSNGNRIIATGTYTRLDGTERTAADLDFATGRFWREFPDTIALANAARSLVDIRDSGAVRDLRDLREAASLSPELASAVAALEGVTRAEALAARDNVTANADVWELVA